MKVIAYMGSPPPMRGKVPKSLTCQIANRITPAYAGKSDKCAGWTFSDVGSPPPMRGKVNQKQLPIDANGITPAYAGKRGMFPTYEIDNEDHPRLCGEKLRSDHIQSLLLGSPPPMRGKAN